MIIYGIRLYNCQSFYGEAIIPFNPKRTIIDGVNDNGKSAIGKSLSLFSKPMMPDDYSAMINFNCDYAEVQVIFEDYYTLKCCMKIPPKRKTPDVTFIYTHGMTELRRWNGWSPEIPQILEWLTIASKSGNYYNINFKTFANNLFIDTEPDVSTYVINGICVDSVQEARIANLTQIDTELKDAMKDLTNDMNLAKSKLESVTFKPIGGLLDRRSQLRRSAIDVKDLALLKYHLDRSFKRSLIYILQFYQERAYTNSYLVDSYKFILLQALNSLNSNTYIQAYLELSYKLNVIQQLYNLNLSKHLLSYTKQSQGLKAIQYKQRLLNSIRNYQSSKGEIQLVSLNKSYQKKMNFLLQIKAVLEENSEIQALLQVFQDLKKESITQEIQHFLQVQAWLTHFVSQVKTRFFLNRKIGINLILQEKCELEQVEKWTLNLQKRILITQLKHIEMGKNDLNALKTHLIILHKKHLIQNLIQYNKSHYLDVYTALLKQQQRNSLTKLILSQLDSYKKSKISLNLLNLYYLAEHKMSLLATLAYGKFLYDYRLMSYGICPTCGQSLYPKEGHTHARLS